MREIDQALFDAIMADRPERIGPLVGQGADTDAFHELMYDECRPMHVAAWDGRVACLRALLDAGASPYAFDEYLSSPLHHAAGQGNTECVKLLLAAGTDVNVENEYGCTPLHDAARGNHKECIRLLLANGANINKFGRSCGTPLRLAAAEGHIGCVRLLLSNGAKTTVNMYPYPLTAFVGRCGYAPMSAEDALLMGEVLLEAGADPSGLHEGLCSLYENDSLMGIDAVQAALRRALLEYLVTLNLVCRHNDKGYTLLHIMCRHGTDATAAELALALDAGADPGAITTFGDTPLQILESREDAPAALVVLLRTHAAPRSETDAANDVTHQITTGG